MSNKRQSEPQTTHSDIVFVERLASMFGQMFALGVLGLRRCQSERVRKTAQLVACFQLHLLKTITSQSKRIYGLEWGSLDGRIEPQDLSGESTLSDRDYMDRVLANYNELISMAGFGAIVCDHEEIIALCRAAVTILGRQRERFELYREQI